MSLLVSEPAPEWSGSAVVDGAIVQDFNLNRYRGQYLLLFFYPLDFTFVCPTELHAFQEALPQFQQRNGAVVGCSVDSCHAHLAWLRTPKAQGGIEGISYPLISDINKELAKLYGVLHPSGVALRGLFLIDREGILRHQLVNDLPLGRSIEEALRTLDSWQAYEEMGEVCPANWRLGQRQLNPSQSGLETYFGQRDKDSSVTGLEASSLS